MRASRLLSILNILQARSQVTAPYLATECEVSLRTIYRDIDALSAAGIPVYSERGPEGGYRLLDGYRLRLNGLSAPEAEALFLTAPADLAADLGLGAALATAQTKLRAALPPDLRASAERMRHRFHLDAPGWFAKAEAPRHLPALTGAIWRQVKIRMRYQSWNAEKSRVVEPLGLVLKGGAWYLVAQEEGAPRSFRVLRIRDLEVLETGFERPKAFDLARYWQAATQELEAELHPTPARLRLSPLGIKLLQSVLPPSLRAAIKLSAKADRQGWHMAEVPLGQDWQAVSDLLRLGAEAEVITPLALRRKMKRLTQEMAALYEAPVAIPDRI